MKNKSESVFEAQNFFPEPKRSEKQKDAIELRCDPLNTVRVGFIGLGIRGLSAIERFVHIEHTEIKVLCDIIPENIEKCRQFLSEESHPIPDIYTEKDDWEKVCERDDIDLIYVCTHWDLHTPLAVYAMEQGKHVALEVPAALTIEQCWQLVETAEKTRRHCIQLENCNYDFFETSVLNMAQKGMFGEIVHCEGAYIHDLRSKNFDENGYWDMWRLKHLVKTSGNTYPTHDLGPLCHLLNIHRGDKMDYIVSVSSGQFGMTAYAKEKFGEDSDYAKTDYKKGDINTSVIRTEKGKTIMLQHDVTSPRPTSRLYNISGSKGFVQKYPIKRMALEPNSEQFISEDDMESLLRDNMHPIIKDIERKAKEVGGHGGMDYIMDHRLIYCLRNGLPLDQDVYDAAEWSAIIELSRVSAENGSIPVKIPDFTRGAWKKAGIVKYYK